MATKIASALGREAFSTFRNGVALSCITAPTLSIVVGGTWFGTEYHFHESAMDWESIKKAYKIGFVIGLVPVFLPFSPLIVPSYYLFTKKYNYFCQSNLLNKLVRILEFWIPVAMMLDLILFLRILLFLRSTSNG